MQYLSVDKNGKPVRTDAGDLNVQSEWLQEDYIELPADVKLRFGRV